MKNQITYTQQGDYLFPDLRLPEQPKVEIGIWGKRHLSYIEKYHKIRYFNLLTSCKLIAYLADIDELAQITYEKLVEMMAQKEGVEENLKRTNTILWVRKMNSIRNRAMGIVNEDIIFK